MPFYLKIKRKKNKGKRRECGSMDGNYQDAPGSVMFTHERYPP